MGLLTPHHLWLGGQAPVEMALPSACPGDGGERETQL